MRRLTILAVLLILTNLLPRLGHTQEPGKLIVVLTFEGKYGKAATEALLRELDKSNHLVMDSEWFYSMALDEGFEEPGFYKVPRQLVAVSEPMRIDVLIDGVVEKRKKRYYLELTVYDGVTGLAAGQVTIKLKGKKLTDALAQQAVDELEPLIATMGWLQHEEMAETDPPVEPEPVPEPQPQPEPTLLQHDTTEPTGELDPMGQDVNEWLDDRGPARYVFKIDGGCLFNVRDYSFTSAGDVGFAYDTMFHPGVALNVEFMPFVLLGPAEWYTELGLRAAATLGFASTTIIGRPNSPYEADTGHNELEGGLFYRIHLGNVEEGAALDLSVGYRMVTFSIAEDEIFYTSAQYSSLNVGLDIIIPFREDIRLDLGGHVMPVLSVGDSEVEYGAPGGLGWGFDLGMSYDLFGGPRAKARAPHALDKLYMGVRYDFEAFSVDYEGTGQRETIESAQTSDMFHRVFVVVGYRIE